MANYQGKKPISTFIQPSYINYPKIQHDNSKIKKLFQLVQNNNIDELKSYVDENKLTWSVINDNQETLLHSVLDNEFDTHTEKEDVLRLSMVRFLLSQGINIDHANIYGITLLHLAVGNQDDKVVTLLLNARASSNVKDNHGMTPLHYAVIGLKKKAEPIRRISSIITDDQSNKKINNKWLDAIVQQITDILRGTEQLSYFTKIFEYYDQIYSKDYKGIIMDGFKKIVDVMSEYTGISEFNRKLKFENIINGIKKEIEGKITAQVKELITSDDDFSNSTFIDNYENTNFNNFGDNKNMSKKYMQNQILSYDKKVYEKSIEIRTYALTITTEYFEYYNKTEELFRYYGNVIGYNIPVDFITLLAPNNIPVNSPLSRNIHRTRQQHQNYVDFLNRYVPLYNELFINISKLVDPYNNIFQPYEVITDSLNLNVIKDVDTNQTIHGQRIYELKLFKKNNGKYEQIGKIVFNIPAILYDTPIAKTLKEKYFRNTDPLLVGGVLDVNQQAPPPDLPDINEYFENIPFDPSKNYYNKTYYEFFMNGKYLHNIDEDKNRDEGKELYKKKQKNKTK